MIGAQTPFMVDANQARTLDEAPAAGGSMQAYGLGWLEEPLRADAPLADWQRLATRDHLVSVAGA